MISRPCPACDKETVVSRSEAVEDGAFYRCLHCGLQYVDPVPLSAPVFQDFVDDAQHLFSRVEGGEKIDSFLTSNEKLVLRWLRRHLPSRAPILELCCEAGRFLAVLQDHGFRPVGMDPLSRPIEFLRKRGFTVEVGMIESYPRKWPEPAAVVVLESLVRFPRPVEFIDAIRRRFPRAIVCLTVPSPRRSLKVPQFDRRLDYPPHHLTRWTPRALVIALERVGYRGKCRIAHVELGYRSGSLRGGILKIMLVTMLRLTGESEYSIVAFGRPA